ncbi:hypothetical protein ACIRLA_46275 [Streptomyces sp. NPDC102364]|uniref:hypothetical protein n=1 Tax=Streptomyces sp. NPDC102364 TaxID=3366161 RepID=UPI00381D070C
MNIEHLDLAALTYAEITPLKVQALDLADMAAYRRLHAAQFAAARREADAKRYGALGR